MFGNCETPRSSPESFDAEMCPFCANLCGEVLARAARTGDQCTITGFPGSSAAFDEAMGSFALTFADQTERDHAVFKSAVKSRKIKAYLE
jgi:hypothetical protein